MTKSEEKIAEEKNNLEKIAKMIVILQSSDLSTILDLMARSMKKRSMRDLKSSTLRAALETAVTRVGVSVWGCDTRTWNENIPVEWRPTIDQMAASCSELLAPSLVFAGERIVEGYADGAFPKAFMPVLHALSKNLMSVWGANQDNWPSKILRDWPSLCTQSPVVADKWDLGDEDGEDDMFQGTTKEEQIALDEQEKAKAKEAKAKAKAKAKEEHDGLSFGDDEDEDEEEDDENKPLVTRKEAERIKKNEARRKVAAEKKKKKEEEEEATKKTEAHKKTSKRKTKKQREEEEAAAEEAERVRVEEEKQAAMHKKKKGKEAKEEEEKEAKRKAAALQEKKEEEVRLQAAALKKRMDEEKKEKLQAAALKLRLEAKAETAKLEEEAEKARVMAAASTIRAAAAERTARLKKDEEKARADAAARLEQVKMTAATVKKNQAQVEEDRKLAVGRAAQTLLRDIATAEIYNNVSATKMETLAVKNAPTNLAYAEFSPLQQSNLQYLEDRINSHCGGKMDPMAAGMEMFSKLQPEFLPHEPNAAIEKAAYTAMLAIILAAVRSPSIDIAIPAITKTEVGSFVVLAVCGLFAGVHTEAKMLKNFVGALLTSELSKLRENNVGTPHPSNVLAHLTSALSFLVSCGVLLHFPETGEYMIVRGASHAFGTNFMTLCEPWPVIETAIRNMVVSACVLETPCRGTLHRGCTSPKLYYGMKRKRDDDEEEEELEPYCGGMVASPVPSPAKKTRFGYP